ncbi:MAG: hypothetical protein ACLFNW_12540 [Desulfobacterales bacterium]
MYHQSQSSPKADALEIRRDTVLLFFVAAMIFLWSNGFNLRVFDISARFKLLQLAGMFVIFSIGMHRLLSRPLARYLQYNYFRFIAGMLAAMLFPTFVYMVLINGLSPINVFHAGLLYPGLFIFIILMSYKTDTSFIIRLNRLIFVAMTGYILFLIFLAETPALADALLVKTSDRFGLVRIVISHGMGPFAIYAFCYALVQATKGGHSLKGKTLYFSVLLVYIWYFFTIALGRRTMLVLIFLLGYYWFFHLRPVRKVQTAFAAVFLVIVLPFVFPQSTQVAYSVYSAYESSVVGFDEYEGGAKTRIEGMEYNLNLFQDTAYIGLGLLSNRLPGTDPYRYGRVHYRYHAGDHGLVAVLYRFGFPGLILTLFILYQMFKDLNVIYRHGREEYRSIALGLHLYLVFCLAGLLQIFWKDNMSLWVGLMFFMVWRMRMETGKNGKEDSGGNQAMSFT